MPRFVNASSRTPCMGPKPQHLETKASGTLLKDPGSMVEGQIPFLPAMDEDIRRGALEFRVSGAGFSVLDYLDPPSTLYSIIWGHIPLF